MIGQSWTQEALIEAVSTLGWDVSNDDLEVAIGGCAYSGIHQSENANPKWSKPFGTTTYQKDAFIVIRNKSRSPFESSKPLDHEHKPHHAST